MKFHIGSVTIECKCICCLVTPRTSRRKSVSTSTDSEHSAASDKPIGRSTLIVRYIKSMFARVFTPGSAK